MFSRQSPSKKWHRKAMLIDPRKTTLVFRRGYSRSGHVPPWIYKSELEEDVKEFLLPKPIEYPASETISSFTHMEQ